MSGPIRLGVRGKLTGLVLLLLVPLFLWQAAREYTGYERRIAMELHQSQISADAVALAFANYLDSLWDTEMALGTVILAKQGEPVEPAIGRLLNYQVLEHPTVTALSWVTPDGQVVASTGTNLVGSSLADREYVQRLLAGEEKVVSNLLVSRVTERPAVTVARGIYQDGRLAGIVVAGINLEKLEQVLPARPESRRRSGLVDTDGNVVFRNRGLPQGLDGRRLPAGDPIRRSLEGEVVLLRDYRSPFDDTELMGTSVAVPRIGWAYYSTMPRSDALASALLDLQADLVVLLLVAVIAFALALFLADRFLQPILALRRAALAIAHGELSARVGLTGEDEVAVTAATFDDMARRVQTADEVQKSRVTAIAYLSQRALERLSVVQLATEAAEAVIRSLGVQYAAVWELLPDEQGFRLLAAAGWPGGVPDGLEGLESLPGYALRHGGMAVLEAVAADPTAMPERVAGMIDGLSVLIPGQQRPYGVVAAYSDHRRLFTQSDTHWLQAVANVLATAMEQQREAANEAFLTEASALLASSLDYEATFFGVARLAVNYMADWCAIDVRQPDGTVRRIAAAHRDPAMERLAWEEAMIYPYDPSGQNGPAEAFRNGRSVLRTEITDALVQAASRSEAHYAFLRAFGFRSAMYVPLMGRGQVMGLLLFFTAESGRRYASSDLEVAEELGRRASQAMEHSRLFRDAQAALQLRDWALAEATLERARLHSIFQHAPVLICIVRGPDHMVTMANRLCLEAVGHRPIVGKPLREGVPELGNHQFLTLLDEVYRTGISVEAREQSAWVRRTPDGPPVEGIYNLVFQPMRDAEGAVDGTLVYAADVTQEVEARRRTEELAARQAAIAGLGQRLLEGGDLPSLFDAAVDLVAQTLQADICELMESLENQDQLVLRASRGTGPVGQVVDVPGLTGQAGPGARALSDGTVVVAEDLLEDPRFALPERLRTAGAVSGLVVLIPGERQPFGVMAIYSRHRRGFADDEIHFLQTVVHAVSAAMEHHRSQRRLETQHAVSMILAESPGTEDPSAMILRAVCEGLGWHLGLYWSVDTDIGVLRCQETWQVPEMDAGEFLAFSRRWQPGPDEGLVGRVWETGEPLWIADLSQVTGFSRCSVVPARGLRSGFWFPILLRREVYGIIECFRSDFWQPDPALLRAMTTIGGQVGQFLERKRTEAEVRRLNAELEGRVVRRTEELAAANQELEAFAYSVSHDLRAPLRTIDGFSQALMEDYADGLNDEARDHLTRIRGATRNMAVLIDDLLRLSRVMRSEMHQHQVNLSRLARLVMVELRRQDPGRTVTVSIQDGLTVVGDERLLGLALQNLLANAWKFTSRTAEPCIAFGSTKQGGRTVYYVQDNGAGFDMAYADKLFVPFQRLHSTREFEGTGIGLATVQRIVRRHGGQVWAEGVVGEGATFYFTL